MKKTIVAGLVNIETSLGVENFPLDYKPITFNFFGTKSIISGVAYNIQSAMDSLDNPSTLVSLIGKDLNSSLIEADMNNHSWDRSFISQSLNETPVSVVLFDNDGKRRIFCDLKDIQDTLITGIDMDKLFENCDTAVVCNINFARPLLKEAKSRHIPVATDVHVLSDINDEYNKEFMEYAQVLFLSDENVKGDCKEFLLNIEEKYNNDIIVMGLGSKGAMMYSKKDSAIYNIDAVFTRPVINTVGAGDALFSAFVHYYNKKFDAIECLKRAVVFASYKIGESGAAVGFCNENTVEKYVSTINFNIRKIDF